MVLTDRRARVTVKSTGGEIKVPVEVTDAIKPGVSGSISTRATYRLGDMIPSD